MSELMEKLKPCPFCGGKAILNGDPRVNFAFCECEKCGARTNTVRISLQYCANDVAIAAWNRRQNDE